jgi:murein DD-endopeptidase MepM/ murein hydrolase activator NlpD
MNKFTNAAKRFGGFMKRNAFYFLIVLCIASVATVIALAVTRDINPDNPVIDTPINPDDPDDPVINPDPLTFILPVNNGTIINDFDITDVVWNPTLGQWATHEGVDYVSEDMNVYCVADGKIKETGYNDLDGYYVIIEHDEGYVSCYYSLEEASTLAVGSEVAQGKLLGKMSASQGNESLAGVHLHFELMKDGEYINPASVIVQDDK